MTDTTTIDASVPPEPAPNLNLQELLGGAGRFRIPHGLMHRSHPTHIRALFRDFIPMEVLGPFGDPRITYGGFHPDWEVIVPGELPPFYDAVITETGPRIEVRWTKSLNQQ